MMSHEIRTPMNAIAGMAELLQFSRYKHDARPKDDDGEMIAVIQDSARDLLRIIDDILDFSKVEAGKIELESIAFDPATLMSVIAGTMRLAAETKGLALKTEIGAELEAVRGDPGRLR